MIYHYILFQQYMPTDNVVTWYATRYYFKNICQQIMWSHDIPLDIISTIYANR